MCAVGKKKWARFRSTGVATTGRVRLHSAPRRALRVSNATISPCLCNFVTAAGTATASLRSCTTILDPSAA